MKSTIRSTMISFTEVMLLLDAKFLGMGAVFGGNPSWVVAPSGTSLAGRQVCLCDVDGTNSTLGGQTTSNSIFANGR